MKRIGITFILLVLSHITLIWSDDNAVHTAPQINECLPPALEEMDDFFKVNPTLRQHYYIFLARVPSMQMPSEFNDLDLSTPEEYRYQGQFRLFVADFFKNNHKLVLEAEALAMKSEAPRDQTRTYEFKDNIKEIEKLSKRLSQKIGLLIPVEMEGGFNQKELTKYYRKMLSDGHLSILLRILLLKTNAVQGTLCDFFFPQSFTVSVDNLSSRRSPKHDLDEIRLIANLLYKRFPSKGFPTQFK